MPGPPPKSSDDSTDLELGYVSGVFGVRGEVRLFLHNRESDLLSRPRMVTLVSPKGELRSVELRARPGAGKRIIGRITGLSERSAVEPLVDWRIRIGSNELPELDDDEFYVHQVLGAQVIVGDDVVGEVKTVHESGPHTVFEVRLTGGGTGYVPALETHLLELDLENRRLIVAPGALAIGE